MEPMARYRYLLYAYENMAQWITQGDEEVVKLKRYVHRYFTLPSILSPAIDHDVAQEVLTSFGFHYIDALLRYCGDDMKAGIRV